MTIQALRKVSLVLIESDWNLKLAGNECLYILPFGINRIRLEFKVASRLSISPSFNSINRIRLEFKATSVIFPQSQRHVLIESDWNLKMRRTVHSLAEKACINRIRLEFKVVSTPKNRRVRESINRIRLEFKV